MQGTAADLIKMSMVKVQQVLDDEQRATKEQREHAALERIKGEFTELPWLASTIEAYERLDSDEARYVKIVDKVLPKLTHLLNGGAALREHGFPLEKAHADHLRQREAMARCYPQREALDLFDAVVARTTVRISGVDAIALTKLVERMGPAEAKAEPS